MEDSGKRFRTIVVLLISLLPGLAEPAVASPTAVACPSPVARPSILLRVSGFKNQKGIVNVWVYGSNPSDFLVRDKRILRLAYPVPPTGPMEACIAIPGLGRYAIAVHHDLDSNDKRDMSDGLGFSGNPQLSVLRLKPTYARASFVVDWTTKPVNLVLRYRYGLSIRPVAPQAR